MRRVVWENYRISHKTIVNKPPRKRRSRDIVFGALSLDDLLHDDGPRAKRSHELCRSGLLRRRLLGKYLIEG